MATYKMKSLPEITNLEYHEIRESVGPQHVWRIWRRLNEDMGKLTNEEHQNLCRFLIYTLASEYRMTEETRGH